MTSAGSSADTSVLVEGLLEIDAQFLQQTDSMEACFKAFDADRFETISQHFQSTFRALSEHFQSIFRALSEHFLIWFNY